MKIIFFFSILLMSNLLLAETHHGHHHEKAVSTYHEIESLLMSARDQRVEIINLTQRVNDREYDLAELLKLQKQAMKEVEAGIMCNFCDRPRTLIENELKYTTFEAHLEYENRGMGGDKREGYRKVDAFFGNKIRKAKEVQNLLDRAKKQREDAIWKSFNLRDTLLHPSYSNSLNDILQEYWLAREKTENSMKTNSDIIKELDELLVILPKTDPEYSEFLSIMNGAIRSMKQEIVELNNLRLKANKQVEEFYDDYSGFNNSIKSIAWELGEEPELGTAGSFVGNSFNIPAFQILVGQPIQTMSDDLDDFVDNRTRGLINRWSRGL